MQVRQKPPKFLHRLIAGRVPVLQFPGIAAQVIVAAPAHVGDIRKASGEGAVGPGAAGQIVQRGLVVALGEIAFLVVSLAMLRGEVFSRLTGVMGIIASVLLTSSTIWLTFLPAGAQAARATANASTTGKTIDFFIFQSPL